MNYKVTKLNSFKVCGFSVELTTSMSKNLKIVGEAWKVFNRRIRKYNLKQGSFWTKYGITYNKDNQYRYFLAIPLIQPTPLDFEIMEIPDNYCLIFEHRGYIDHIPTTYNRIYRDFIPNNYFKPDTSNYFHFEKYNYKFNYHSSRSIFEIYLPIDILKKVIYVE